jgi:hypothetical protein
VTALAVDAHQELRDYFRKLDPSAYKAEYRDLAKHLHPDHGGTHELFVALKDVYEEACNGRPKQAEEWKDRWFVSGWGTEPDDEKGRWGKRHAKRDCFTLRRVEKVIYWTYECGSRVQRCILGVRPLRRVLQ